MSTEGSGEADWNAAVVSSGNPGLYDSYEAYFADLAARRTVPGNDYNAVRPPATYGKFTPYYFPRTDGIDTVAQTLASVDCTGSTRSMSWPPTSCARRCGTASTRWPKPAAGSGSSPAPTTSAARCATPWWRRQ